jgi:tetratricopeptide (TPR) repeat protein
MNATPAMISPEEQEQLQQTIEMFEVIVQASPQDSQSMEILKDAYSRLGKPAEALSVGRRLADTYFELGQYSQAMIEYESLLQKDPNNVEIIAALGEVEERLQKSGQVRAAPSSGSGGPGGSMAFDGGGINLDFRSAVTEASTLITTDQTTRHQQINGGRDGPMEVSFSNDGNESMARFLLQHRLVPEEVVTSALERVTKKNLERGPNTLAASMIDEMCRRGAVELEALLSSIIDRSKFAYVPLEYYDVDRAVVKMLPEEITLGRLIVPFDVMSRTLMVAMANPFDAAGKEAVQQVLDYNLQWHLASPEAIAKVLGETYRLGSSVNDTSSFRLAQ